MGDLRPVSPVCNLSETEEVYRITGLPKARDFHVYVWDCISLLIETMSYCM